METIDKLKVFLKKNGSKDIEVDIKMFNRISSEKNIKKLERLAKNLSGNTNITLMMSFFSCSYAAPNEHGILINIDPTMAYEPNDNFERLWLKCQGLVSHEAGHILYSDFEIVGKNKQKCLNAQKIIPVIGNNIADKSFDAASVHGKQMLKKLEDTIYDYIYYKQLTDMLNSIEDGAIEHLVPSYAPRVHGSIVALRNLVYKKEKKFLKNKFPIYKLEDKDDIGYFIDEIRHYAVIGYRQELKPIFIPSIFNNDTIREIELLALYGRIASTSTEERNAISEVLLDMLSPLIKKKAHSFMLAYLNNLDMTASEMESMMNMEMEGHTEVTCLGNMNSSLAGSTIPQKITSDYEMELPKKTMDKINEKMKKKEEEKNTESQNGDDNKSKTSDDSSDNQLSGNMSESTEKNDEGRTSNEPNNKGSSSENENDDSKNEGNADSEGVASDNLEGEGDTKSTGEVKSSIQKNNLSNKKAAAISAETAYKDSLKKLEKSFEKEKATEFKQALDDGNGKAPRLQNNMVDINSISDLHKGIKTEYFPSSTFTKMSITGKSINNRLPQLNKQAGIFSKKLKEILMYQAKTRRKNGLKNGVIHDAALNRIITDQRVFRKKINGVEKKARIAVLIDLSGSMCGVKVEDALSASYMLADSCERIKVPISIMGHNTRGDNVNLFHFIEYENCMKKDSKNKLLSAAASGANHDGLAIFHAATDLVRHRRQNEQLVLLVISDGAPAGINDYFGKVADEDIKKMTNTFEKQFAVKTIGIGIGNDVKHVPDIYKNFLIVPHVDKLGDELLKVLKSLLLK